ncbi:LysR family transcriptional regulator [Aliiroseovarius crassostreae]|uniref:LysR family transcriptional regulator n=1 Tax=Aliiroseovarius crassostreae TaxID=154981 RepID=A0A9Q9HCP7_9RHOB|nr:LysR family transcriptional regulator [Aliiroseovarius crassostreae]UWP89497.1 LysR family transcriptional regulator [Aliiroseovarius crassostreae]UWP92634.1 LysR family transcriptional regulator [Aliiroseovarius crassostreae]UWP95774.1 LysR family transcriptional regulator [Aliiroseovarius crassostreae]UWP98946.1 LysR family transcriptional regulator [Aliiroseovarius crassostreae]UWQ02139.1 LysR family transcriptional regulator [Aliiroseovarius crassostreae]
MPRNLDMTALRSFATVADAGGVTRAAGLLNLTQSAVSMQLKRLEESLGRGLLDRSGRGVALTADGEQLLGYARRMLNLNDEVFLRLTDHAYEGEIVLGVPSDVVYPAIPKVLKAFHAEYPRMKVQLISSYTSRLKSMFARGECDIILTTEDTVDGGGETLITLPLVWVGAPGGGAWKMRPLRLAFQHGCIFRTSAQKALDDVGIAWEMAVESDSTRTIEASLSADLAVHAVIEGTTSAQLEVIDHGGALPELKTTNVNMYTAESTKDQASNDLLTLIRTAFLDL